MGCCRSKGVEKAEYKPLVAETPKNTAQVLSKKATTPETSGSVTVDTTTTTLAVPTSSPNFSSRPPSHRRTSSSGTTMPTETFGDDDEKDFRTKCRALWDWNGDPTDPVQIEFKTGDIIALIDKEEDGGWWYGECLRTKAVGFFPGNYVEVLTRNWKVDANKINPKIAALQQNLMLGEVKN